MTKRLMGWSPEVHAAELAERRDDAWDWIRLLNAEPPIPPDREALAFTLARLIRLTEALEFGLAAMQRERDDEYEVLNLIADTAAALLAEPWRHRQAEQELYLAGYLARLEKIRSGA